MNQTVVLPENRPSRILVFAALLCVYLFWGGTYLGMKIAIESVPPFLMAGIRFLLSGGILCSIAIFQGKWKVNRKEGINAAFVGALLLFCGNGGVVWATQMVPSYIASILVAAAPVWMILLNWAAWSRKKPSGKVFFGMILGLSGIGVLVFGSGADSSEVVHRGGALLLVAASMCWAVGSLYSRNAAMPKSTMMSIAIQMFSGGALLLVASIFTKDWSQVNFSAISLRSAVAFFYLVFFGSVIAYTAYIWLMKNAEPSLVSTYAFVNPIVAVFIGGAVAGEPLTSSTLLSSAIIIAAVVVITLAQHTPSNP